MTIFLRVAAAFLIAIPGAQALPGAGLVGAGLLSSATMPVSAGCTLPKPSENSQIVLLSAYEGQGLSTATIGSQDVAVNTAEIAVASGARPLYVVIVSFRPVIWRFTGATRRIERAVLSSGITGPGTTQKEEPPLAGATGLAAEKVSFPQKARCLRYFSETPSIHGAMAGGSVNAMLGRAPDIVAAQYAVSSFDLPSGTPHKADRIARGSLLPRFSDWPLFGGGNPSPARAAAERLAADVTNFYPDGVVSIDPATVVASRPVERYEVLPNQAGLQQLVEQGALTTSGNEFHIHRKIHFPAELYGAHSARFLLLKGVPEPDGDPGHSCVVSEETGQPLANGRLC